MFIKFLVTILNCVCLKCSKLKLSREEIDLEINVLEHDRFIRYIDRLNIIYKKCNNVAYCTDCHYPHPEIKEVDGFVEKVYDSIDKKGEKKRSRIEIEELRVTLMKITIADLETMGFQPQTRKIMRHGKILETVYTFRPEWLILSRLPVIPPMSRPPDNEGDMRSDDDLTSTYAEIIKYNERLKDTTLDEVNRANTLVLLHRNINALFDNSDGTVTRNSGKAAKGIKERICGKNGHIRGKLSGKRVDCSARSVITAGANLRVDELGVPEEIAQSLSFPEKVTPRNAKELNLLYEQDKINVVRRNNKNYETEIAKKNGKITKLKYGDIVYRQLRDGDTVVFNRQPTLHRGSMMAHKIRVLPGKTFRLNLSVTSPYNADEQCLKIA